MIRPSGPLKAKIALVGEAPGETEEKLGVPFVGTAGRLLDGMLTEAGIERSECYITNVVLERPPGNNFGIYYEKSRPTPELLSNYERLRCELAQVQPNVIIALGAEALKALTPHFSIQHWRGSVLATSLGKVIPTIHPAAVLRDWLFRPAVVSDLIRAKAQAQSTEIFTRERTLFVPNSFSDAVAVLKKLKGVSHVAFDIETETDQITCIGFSDRPDWAVCIPFWFGSDGSLWDEPQEVELWGHIQEILESQSVKKIAHNGSYDIEFLARTTGISVANYFFDTMLGFHLLYPELPQGLDYLVSIYTDHPYYKFGRKANSMDELFKYNATDCCLTFECYEHIYQELLDAKQLVFYERFVHALIDPLLAAQTRGVCFDIEKRGDLRTQCKHELGLLLERLTLQVGRELNVNSPKQMKEWLYGKEGLALKVKTKKRGTGQATVSADEEALKSLYKESGNEAIQTILQMREKKKLLSTYLEVKLDADNRIRCSYFISGTETGRLSSRTTARGTGTNLQNIPAGIVKQLFVADAGCVLLNADLSQAEARVVAYLAGDQRLIKVFESGGDIHRKNASNIFGIAEQEVNDEQRSLAKRVVHASNYGMGPITFARTAGITGGEAKRLLNLYFATYPGVRNWQVSIADRVKRTRQLVNPFGRRRTFFGRYGDALVKEALAFIPQSTVADITNQAIVELHEQGVEVLLQVHDSVVVQARQEDVELVVAVLKDALTKPVEIDRRVLVIPVDVKIGSNWQDMKKYEPAKI